ncbi:uncharacterized protein LOC105213192 [Zeugodacus cucurbitae]|uniref:uncharacterized protein LOC105213192 n=1 Tax=Zeugodacus cucurbitae TaxID=28588 RepID=UPI0023D8E649|nr:uncharacterized protein LOC105213192 [Zeugodacus cucurbitae]
MLFRLVRIVFFISACCLGVNNANLQNDFEHFSIFHSNNENFTRGIKELIERIQTEDRFVSYFLQRNHASDCVDEDLAKNFKLPFMQLNESKRVYVRGTGNSILLVILCISRLTDKDFLLKFAKQLQHIRSRRILVIHNDKLAASTRTEIETFFRNCMQVKFLHVILVHRDFTETNVFHSLNQFPEFELETRDLRTTASIYPNRFVNAKEKKLSVLADQIEPITMLYEKGDTLILEGYIGYFMKAFALKYNFRLWLPIVYEPSIVRVISMEEIRQAARNGSIDVGASLSTPQKEANLHEYIYPIEFFQWLTMLPVEPPLETYYFFISIFSPTSLIGIFLFSYCVCVLYGLQLKLRRKTLYWNRALLLLLLMPWHLDLLRGLLNQSTAMRLNSVTRRIIFILVFALGGTLNNFFSTKMVNWLTVPPHEQPIEKFREVAEHNLQIQIPEPDVAEIKFYRGEKFWKKYNRVFNVVKSVDEFQENIRKMDTRYGYLMNTLVWPIVEQRQRYFKNPLFRLSQNLYYTKGSLLSLPISENSIYKDLLSNFSLRSRESGLLDYWYSRTFYTMVSIGRFNLTDLSKKYTHEVLTLKEFEWVWITYGVGIGLSVLVFIFEWICYKFTNAHII